MKKIKEVVEKVKKVVVKKTPSKKSELAPKPREVIMTHEGGSINNHYMTQ